MKCKTLSGVNSGAATFPGRQESVLLKITLKYVHEVPTSRRWFMTSLVMAFAIFLLKGKVWKVPVCGMHGTIPGTLKERPRTQQCPGEAALETRLCSGSLRAFPLWAGMH